MIEIIISLQIFRVTKITEIFQAIELDETSCLYIDILFPLVKYLFLDILVLYFRYSFHAQLIEK